MNCMSNTSHIQYGSFRSVVSIPISAAVVVSSSSNSVFFFSSSPLLLFVFSRVFVSYFFLYFSVFFLSFFFFLLLLLCCCRFGFIPCFCLFVAECVRSREKSAFVCMCLELSKFRFLSMCVRVLFSLIHVFSETERRGPLKMC